MLKSHHRMSQERFVEAALQVDYHPDISGTSGGAGLPTNLTVHLFNHLASSLISSSTIRRTIAAMESQKYHLLEGDKAEEGNSRHAPRFLSTPTRARESTRRNILFIAVVGIGAFVSGVIFTLTLSMLQARVGGRGKYETGFREEGLCKSGPRARYSPIRWTPRACHVMYSSDRRGSTRGTHTARRSPLQITGRLRDQRPRVPGHKPRRQDLRR